MGVYFAFTVQVLTMTVVVAAVTGTELIPERFLRPRDFNHHPFTDVGVPASVKSFTHLPQRHPYAILSTKKPREGRPFPQQDVVLYPNPHPSVLPQKQIETNEVDVENDPYIHVPKNYAFSYSVRDVHSGDDFSHSQAHNGKATRGQYRVKLPDGRLQIVSYTADHKGYRADVQYQEAHVTEHNDYQGGGVQYQESNIADLKGYRTNIQNVDPTPVYQPQTPTALPVHKPNVLQTLEHYDRSRQQGGPPVQFPQQQSTTEAPAPVEQPAFRIVAVYPSPPPSPGPERFQLGHGIASTTAPHLLHHYGDESYARNDVTSPATPFESQRFVTLSPEYDFQQKYLGARAVRQRQVLVTPRPVEPRGLKPRPHIVYQYVQEQ